MLNYIVLQGDGSLKVVKLENGRDSIGHAL